ncbi:MAG: transglutaminase domain-containing protein [Terrisporobacter sp.]|uniref:transglutaminase domain-containing protein n=1 Tax=Terrisporobacter sp. TaxID=1965305 RepID=UPI002FCC7170
MKHKFIVLLILIISIFTSTGCIAIKGVTSQLQPKIEEKINSNNEDLSNNKNESQYVQIKYNPYLLGKRAKLNLSKDAVKFYEEILIPGVLKRDKKIPVPSTLNEYDKAIVTNYFQQNSPLEYFAGTPFFNVEGDCIMFDYANCVNMTDEEYDKEVKKISESIEEVINTNIKKNYNYMDTILALYKYLSFNTLYNKEAQSTNAYGIIVNDQGTCVGFAQSMQILLTQLNLDEGYQVEWTSNDNREGHAWNALKLNNKWYYFDTTWENSSTGGEGLQYFAMNMDRRAIGDLSSKQYTMSPLSLLIPVPKCYDNRFDILEYCSQYELNLDNHSINFKSDLNNKWYILNTEDYSIKEKI